MWCYGATSIPRGVGSWPNGAVRGCFHFPHPVLSAEGKIIIETTASTVFQHSTYLNSRSIKSICTQYFSVLRTRTLHARSGLKKRILYSGHSAKTWNYSKILSILILILLLIPGRTIPGTRYYYSSKRCACTNPPGTHAAPRRDRGTFLDFEERVWDLMVRCV